MTYSTRTSTFIAITAITTAFVCTWLAKPKAADAQATAPSPRAARSIHLNWEAPEGTDFYNELTVRESTRGTYFMACGFRHGYFGMQDLNGKPRGLAGDNGKTDKVVIFSIWDVTKGDSPKNVPEEQRVELLAQGPDVRIGRFGGEGTGGQSFYSYPWKVGETCRFLVRSKVEGEKTTYSGYFYRNDTKAWVPLATFRTITKGKPMGGYYSFIEDFRRDGKSVDDVRSAEFGNGWVKTLEGKWVGLTRARFTGDRTPLDTIDSGVRDGRFFLTTGGKTENHTKLKSVVVREGPTGEEPNDLPK